MFEEKTTRRRLVQLGLLSSIGLTLSRHQRLFAVDSIAARADACIFVHLKGGPSHLDTLDMKPDAPSEEQGEFKRIPTVMPGLHVCEHLPRLAKAIDRFTLIRGISHSAGDHLLASKYLYTGNRPSPAVAYPSMGAVSAKELFALEEIPPFVAIPNSNMPGGFLGIGYSAFQTTSVPKQGEPYQVRGLEIGDGLTLDRVQSRNLLLKDLDQTFRTGEANSEVLEGLDQFSRKANAMIMSNRAHEAFDVSRESSAIQALFENDDLSQSLLLAGRLVENGVRFVTVGQDGWDTHLDNFKNHKTKLLPPFDAGITSLVQMLELKGLLDRVLIVATGEFGRTPTINKHAGRDHWPRAMWTLVAGGGTKRGFLFGGTDKKGHGPDDDTHLKPDDLAATIYHALGIDSQHEYHTPTGRPVLLVPDGKVMTEIFA